MRVRPMTAADWPAVRRIYAAGIAGGDATFETEPPGWEDFTSTRPPDHRFVATAADDDGDVLGWVARSAVSRRAVYRGVVEHSVYVDPAAGGRGVGRALLDALVASTERAGVWTVQSAVFPDNAASLRLHAGAGFRVVGVRERLARKRGTWRDVILMERRAA